MNSNPTTNRSRSINLGRERWFHRTPHRNTSQFFMNERGAMTRPSRSLSMPRINSNPQNNEYNEQNRPFSTPNETNAAPATLNGMIFGQTGIARFEFQVVRLLELRNEF